MSDNAKHAIMTAIEEIKPPIINIDFIPKTNLKRVFEQIPIYHPKFKPNRWSSKPDIKLNVLHEVSKPLDEIEAIIAEENETQKNTEFKNFYTTLTFNTVGAIVIIMSIIALYLNAGNTVKNRK